MGEFPALESVLAHIQRSRCPWEQPDLTECGRAVVEFARVVSRDQALARFREIGATRARYEFCVTCWETADRHSTWEADPLAAIGRLPNAWASGERAIRARAELRALGLLVEAHREEFDAAVESLLGTSDLRARKAVRRWHQRSGQN